MIVAIPDDCTAKRPCRLMASTMSRNVSDGELSVFTLLGGDRLIISISRITQPGLAVRLFRCREGRLKRPQKGEFVSLKHHTDLLGFRIT